VAGDTVITVIGNLTADPELRFTPSGAAVANFTVASTPRSFDRQTNEWKDGEALFLRCNIWREAAENVAESLTRGARVIVSGRLKQRSFETREGEKRTVVELEVDEIGPSLKYATAKVNKASRSGGGGGGFGGGGGSRQPAAQSGASAGGASAGGDDPWGSAPASGSFAGGDDEPPFYQLLTTERKRYRHGQVQYQAPPGAGEADQGAQVHLLFQEGTADRLQGHPAAAYLHQRARQDPRPPGDRQLRPAPARRRNRGQERPRSGVAALHLFDAVSADKRRTESAKQ
jgi:single-strand DNA-binding protein